MVAVVEDKREAIAALCRKYGVVRLFVFGSALRDDFRPGESDVDLLVELVPMGRAGPHFRAALLRRFAVPFRPPHAASGGHDQSDRAKVFQGMLHHDCRIGGDALRAYRDPSGSPVTSPPSGTTRSPAYTTYPGCTDGCRPSAVLPASVRANSATPRAISGRGVALALTSTG